MKRTVLSSVLLLLLLGATTGCSRYYWSKPGATAEQFTQDSQTCVQHAATTLPAGAAAEAVEQFYRACLNGRGYVRDKQYDPPPPGSYRGLEDTRQFTAAAQAVAGQAPRQSFEQQLAQLDDLKARGRITDTEYAAMRQRLVEGVTPGALTPPPAPPAIAATPQRQLAGRWYGRNGSTLDIREDGRPLQVGVGAREPHDPARGRHRLGLRRPGIVRSVVRPPARRPPRYLRPRSPSPGRGPSCAEPPPDRTTCRSAWSSDGSAPERADRAASALLRERDPAGLR